MGKEKHKWAARRKARAPIAEPAIVDDLPPSLPICEHELRVLENFLADIISDTISGSQGDPDVRGISLPERVSRDIFDKS